MGAMVEGALSMRVEFFFLFIATMPMAYRPRERGKLMSSDPGTSFSSCLPASIFSAGKGS